MDQVKKCLLGNLLVEVNSNEVLSAITTRLLEPLVFSSFISEISSSLSNIAFLEMPECQEILVGFPLKNLNYMHS